MDPSADLPRVLDAAAQGDPAAQERLVRDHLPALRAFVRLQLPHELRAREAVSDCVQTVFREVLGQLDRFEWRGEASFRNWLFQWARHKLGNRIQFHMAQRRDPRREAGGEAELAQVYASACSPSQVAIRGEALQHLEAAIDELPADCREALAMHRILGMTRAETAAALGVPEAQVQRRVQRAILRLSVLLDSRGLRPAEE